MRGEPADPNTKVNPPLRTGADIEALVEGLRDGTIDTIGTDHAPHAARDKEVGYDKAAFGMLALRGRAADAALARPRGRARPADDHPQADGRARRRAR